jgi:RNA polymerase sigma-70 factor (ECF subfamily)
VPLRADTSTLSTNRGATGMRDRSTSEVKTPVRARPVYACPEDVFAHEYDRLVRVLTIVAGEREAAADAVQESFIRLVRRWERVSTYEDPAGWVRGVALNEIRDHHRSLTRQARLFLRIQQEYSAPESALTSDEELWEQLRTLPARQRTALALHLVGDLTARETAAVMQVSEGTVDRHLHRALQTLRKKAEVEASDE